jgi:inorganic triphosphatase YgiF
MAAIPREIELKFEVDSPDVARIKRHLSRLSDATPVARTLVSVYFDTARWKLREHRLSLRVRRIGREYVQTVKGDGGPAIGLYDRAEWEHSIRGPQPDLSWTTQTPLSPLLHGTPAASLRPVFETRIRRTTYRLARSGAVIAATLDQGSVRAGSRRCRLCELELELSRGAPLALFRVARALGDVAPLHLSIKTKADRGYELLGEKGAVRGPGSVRASPTATAGGAFQTIARGCLRQMIASEKAVFACNGEALHRMRAALRRLRTAIRVFSGVLDEAEAARIMTELRWIGRELGPARDVDVFIADVVRPLRARHAHDRGVSRICRNFERRRALLYGQVAQSLQSVRFRHLELDLARSIEAGRWVTSKSDSASRRRDRPVTLLAAKALARRRKRLRKAGQCLIQLSRRDRHRLRIRAKKLRYIVEFFSDLFPGKKRAKRCRAILSSLEDLQDSLGALNDLARREVLAFDRAWASGPRAGSLTGHNVAPKLFEARVAYASQGTRVDQFLHEAKAAFKRFSRVRPFWE